MYRLRSVLSRTIVFPAALVALGVQPADGVSAQGTPPVPAPRVALAVPTTVSGSLAVRCAAGDPSDPLVRSVAEALAGRDRGGMRAVADSLEAALAGELAAAGGGPPDPDLLYRWALVQGVRVEATEGRDRLAAADELYRRAVRVLEAEPDHAGAHHLLGRLVAGVLRLGGTKRLLARMVVGGDLLASASWSMAREHLERAERGAPCVPEHHVELGRALLASGETDGARREGAHALALAAGGGARAGELRRVAAALRRGSEGGR